MPLERTYHGAAAAGGPLLFVEGTRRVSAGEQVVVRLDGQAERRGQVIDAGERVSVIQMLDDTVALAPHRARIVLTGQVASTVVGRELLGRVFNGHGVPVDGLPAPIGDALRPVALPGTLPSGRDSTRRARTPATEESTL